MDAFPVALAQPLWLLGLLALPLLPPGRGRVLRAAALALLLVALADPSLPRPAGSAAILIDVSDSVGEQALQQAAAIDIDGADASIEVWQFASEAAQVPAADAEVSPALHTGGSDLVRALSAVLARGVGRVLVVSDGRDTRGGLADLRLPVPVDVLPVAARDNLRLDELRLPLAAAPEETVRVELAVVADRAGPVQAEVAVVGGESRSRTVELEAGPASIAFSLPLPAEGPVRVAARVSADYPQPQSDDELAADIDVTEADPVWVVHDPEMARLLESQGVPVREIEPAELTVGIEASAVVLRASSTAFTPAQLEGLATWVDDGGGLLMTGGPESFGLGGWFRTPVEAVLPVDSDLRSDVRVPLVALVMVLDRSQSMASGSPSKIGLARQGAAEVVELAFERDLLGLVAFSDDFEWTFELRPATARGKLEMLSAIRNLGTAGGTVLGPAFAEAIDALEASDASIKHVIVLSDGRLYDGRGPFGGTDVDLVAEARAARQAGISISTIAVGEEADFERLRSLARAGGGRYYEALDVSTLPSIFAGEALTATRSLVRENPGPPSSRAHPLLPNASVPPAPSAYVATTLKPDAEPLWSYGEEALLAVRRQGLGRTAAFTTDLSSWAGELAGWDELPAVLGDLVRWLGARPDRYGAEVRTEDGGATLVVDAVEDGRFLDGLELVARSAGESVPLRAVGPGRYAADLPPGAAGEPVVVSQGGEVVARARYQAQDPEFRIGDGTAALTALARASGGRLLDPGEAWDPGPAPRRRSLAVAFAAAAGLLLLSELALRRLRPG